MRLRLISALLVLTGLIFSFGFSTEQGNALLYPHLPIYIHGDDNFTWENGVMGGNGTKDDPYVISDWAITAGGLNFGIKIAHTDSYFVIENCRISGTKRGISLLFVRNGKIEDCEISNSDVGVYLWFARENEISKSWINKSHDHGIYLLNSKRNVITGNLLTSNQEESVYLELSSSNKIEENEIRENEKGMSLWDSPHNKVISNQMVTNREYGLKLLEATGNEILKNTFDSNTEFGIFMSNSTRNQIEKNLITANETGILVAGGVVRSESSSGNHVAGNNIEANSSYGIWLQNLTRHNLIYHNNFTDNGRAACDSGKNRWDGGYPKGGNYWDNYQGVDLSSGVDQTQSGSDKIGDMVHKIPCGRGIDHYPLMEESAE